MKFSLRNPEKLTNEAFAIHTTEQRQKAFLQTYGTTLNSYRRVKMGECVMLKVKAIFDDIFEGLEWDMCELEYEKYNERSREIRNSETYKELLSNVVDSIKKSSIV